MKLSRIRTLFYYDRPSSYLTIPEKILKSFLGFKEFLPNNNTPNNQMIDVYIYLLTTCLCRLIS
jgi:hypothetical protein